MPLLISDKHGNVKLKLCSKAGNSPYNKTGYMAQVDKERIVDLYDYKGGHIAILRPVIDKMIFEYGFRDCGSHRREIQEEVLKNAHKSLKKIPDMFKRATDENVGGQRLFHLNSLYRENFILIHKLTGAKIIFQIVPRKKNAFLRCDLNPARLGAEGMLFFRNFQSTDR